MLSQQTSDLVTLGKEMDLRATFEPNSDVDAPTGLPVTTQRWIYFGIVAGIVLCSLYGFGILRS